MADIRFARSGDVSIAYHVVGDGPIDLVYAEGSFTHLEVEWDLPAYRAYVERLAEFCRVIRFDKRGMGMSDRVPGATTLETRMDDIRAVMDAVGSQRAAVLGESEGGPLAMLFAAAHPERCRALILQGAEVRERTDEDWPWGEADEARFERSMEWIREHWGEGGSIAHLVPSQGDPAWGREFVARLQRNTGTPGTVEAFQRMAFGIDVRGVAPLIRVPVLIQHAAEDRICHVENARFLARTIPGAVYRERPGGDHIPLWEPDAVIPDIREFLTGQREPDIPDRVLATVLFTDIVDSTPTAVRLGDRRWREVLEAHRAAVRKSLASHRGVEVDTAGDGFLATFDGPARAIRCAREILASGPPLGIAIRAGVHTGEVELRGEKVTGIAVHIGARVAASAGPGEIRVSGTVRDLVSGSGLALDDCGQHILKGVPGEWRLFSVAG